MRAFFHSGILPAKTTVFLDFLERRIKALRFLETV
jgi:hypothetical protein